MGDLVINGKRCNDVQIVKLRPGTQEQAKKAAMEAGEAADDIFFKVGNDTFVASGRALLKNPNQAFTYEDPFLDKLNIQYNGQNVQIVDGENQANTPKEGALWGGMVGGPVAAIVAGFTAATVAPRFGIPPKLAMGIAAGVTEVGAVIGGAIYGSSRKQRLEDIAKLGTVVQKSTESKGGIVESIKTLFGGGNRPERPSF